MSNARPTIGQDVHYVARGSADGVYPPACRAATVTEVDPEDSGRVGLCVTNPTGHHFNTLAQGGSRYDPGKGYPLEGALTCLARHEPGTWHRPTRL